MGFFDQYEDAGGGNFIGKEEKAVLASEGTPLTVTRVAGPVTGKFGEQYIVDVDLNGEDRSISFGKDSVESRDRMLEAMRDYLEADPDAEKPVVKLEKAGQAFLIREAE